MYTVVIRHQNGSLITETEIHNDYYLAPQKKLQSATLELEENTAGTFNFTVPKGQYGNGNGTDIDIKNDEAIVYQNVEVDPDKQTSRGKEIWRGFFLENDTEFFNSKAFTCIGELAYLNETIQKDATYKFEGDNDYPEKVFKALLGVHNAKVPAKKQFQPGTITVKADNTASHLVNRVQTDEFTTAYSDHTFDCIKKLIESCGGYLKVRREDGVRYLDWLNTYEANGQTINFGKNLLDYAVNQDVTDLITVLYPFGESQSETVDDGQGGTTTKRTKVNISTATGQNGRMYVTLNDTGSYSPDPMAELGWREGTVDFPNVRDPNNLKRLAINYLKNQWDPELKLYTKIQIKAVDLAYFRDEDAAPIEFLQSVKVTSIPHGITNKVVPVTKMTIPLLQPEQTIYTMSTAMRKTKQISTSVTDHDKDIEKTQETIDDTGGGEEEEGEGEVVIEGKDPENYWTIGRPTVGKEPSEKSEEEYLKHQKHLKVWYDMSSSVTVCPSLLPYYTWDTTENDWTPNVESFVSARSSTGSVKSAIRASEPSGPISSWAAAFISDDLKDQNDASSHSYIKPGETSPTQVQGYANVQDPYDILVYWSGPWPAFGVAPYESSDGTTYAATVPVGWKTLARTASLADFEAGDWHECFAAISSIVVEKNGNTLTYDLGLRSREEWTYDYNEYELWACDEAPCASKNPESPNPNHVGIIYTPPIKGRIFGSFAKGVMPLASRPLLSDSSIAMVVYIVANFGYGVSNFHGDPAPGICIGNSTGFGVYNTKLTLEPVKSFNEHLCYFYGEGGSDGVESHVRMPALYEIEHIVDNVEREASRPYPIDPIDRWWVYAWVCNIGPGERYAIGSDVTGGLFVGAPSGGAVRTGCAKWGQPLITQGKFGHCPELKLASDAKNQCIYINGKGRTIGPRAETGQSEYPEDEHLVGRFRGAEHYSLFDSRAKDERFTNSSVQIKAIGYCKAAYRQITTDEVVENIKYLSKKYCSE